MSSSAEHVSTSVAPSSDQEAGSGGRKPAGEPGRSWPTSPTVLCELEPVAAKDIADEVRAQKDLALFADEAAVLLDLDAATLSPGSIVNACVDALFAKGRLGGHGDSSAPGAVSGTGVDVDKFKLEARRALLEQTPRGQAPAESSDTHQDALDATDPELASTALPAQNLLADDEADDGAPRYWKRYISGRSFVIPFGNVSTLDHLFPKKQRKGGSRVVVIARLSKPTNLGVLTGHAGGSLTRFIVLVLGGVVEMKEVKTPNELSRSFATLLQDDDFYSVAKSARDPEELRQGIRDYVDNVGAHAGTGSPDVGSPRSGSRTARKRRRGRRGGGGQGGNDEEDVDLEGGDLKEEKTRNESPSDVTFARTGRFAGGLIDDIRRRYKWSVYRSDWTDGLNDPKSLLKYLSTIVWLYFAIIMPTIAFGALDDENTRLPNETKGQIGVIETIVSQAFAGLAFAAFAGQPLTIVMTTAPLTVFIEVLFSWSKSLDIPFLPFYAWTGIWTAAILLILVVTDSCSIMKYCGHFTEEIFATLIAALFIGEYIKPLIKVADDYPTDVFLLAFILATGTFLIAQALLTFKRSFLLRPVIRLLLSDFGVPIAILIMSAARRLFMDVDAEMLAVPEEIGVVTTSGRAWLVPVFDIGVQYIFLAAISGALLATLFFLDQNISSILVNRAENRLKKGPGYYLDLVVVCVIIVVQSILGMPWTHAALPHSPLHARQLADVEEYEAHGRRYERVVKARETRVTGFVTHLLIFLSILIKDALGNIPLSVLYGFFLYMGFATLDGNALWDRILLIFTQPEKLPPNHYVRRVPIRKIHLYTVIQVFLLVVLWFFKSNFYLGDTVFNTGLLFPFIIALFIPVRLFFLPKLFTPKELSALGHEAEIVDESDTGITV